MLRGTWLCRVPPTQRAIWERAPPWRPYGRNFDLEMGLGSIVAFEVEYWPKMTTTAKPSLGYVAVFWLCSERPTQMLILVGAPPRRPYGRNFDLEIGLGSIVTYAAEYGPKMTTTARPSLGRRRGTLFLSRGLGGGLGGAELGGGLAARGSAVATCEGSEVGRERWWRRRGVRVAYVAVFWLCRVRPTQM